MDLQNLATVICPSILYSKGKDPTKDESFLGIRAVAEMLAIQDDLFTASLSFGLILFGVSTNIAVKLQVPEELMAILSDQDLVLRPEELSSKDVLKKVCRPASRYSVRKLTYTLRLSCTYVNNSGNASLIGSTNTGTVIVAKSSMSVLRLLLEILDLPLLYRRSHTSTKPFLHHLFLHLIVQRPSLITIAPAVGSNTFSHHISACPLKFNPFFLLRHIALDQLAHIHTHTDYMIHDLCLCMDTTWMVLFTGLSLPSSSNQSCLR